jgi:hypothetical protein
MWKFGTHMNRRWLSHRFRKSRNWNASASSDSVYATFVKSPLSRGSFAFFFSPEIRTPESSENFWNVADEVVHVVRVGEDLLHHLRQLAAGR